MLLQCRQRLSVLEWEWHCADEDVRSEVQRRIEKEQRRIRELGGKV